MSEPEGALIQYAESVDPMEDLLKQKEFKAAATADGDTDEKEVEKKRRYLSALGKIAKFNMGEALRINQQLSDPKIKADDRKRLNEEFQRLFIVHTMLGHTGSIHGFGLMADCLSVRMEDEVKVSDPKSGEIKTKKRLTRLTVAEILATNLDDEDTAFSFVEKDDIEILAQMFHRFMKKVYPDSLKEKVIEKDALGVEHEIPVPDIFEYHVQRHMEKLEAERLEAEKRARGGIFEDDAKAEENKGMDDLFGEKA